MNRFKYFFLGLLSLSISCSEKHKIQKEIERYEKYEKESYGYTPVDFEDEKKAYKELANLVLNDSDKVKLFSFIDTMQADPLAEGNNLYSIIEFIESNSIPFLIYKNEDNGGFNSVDEVTHFMKINYSMDIDISAAGETYDWNDFTCLVESDKLLRKYAYQYGFIMSGNADNVIIIHAISQKQNIKSIVERTGYIYSEMD